MSFFSWLRDVFGKWDSPTVDAVDRSPSCVILITVYCHKSAHTPKQLFVSSVILSHPRDPVLADDQPQMYISVYIMESSRVKLSRNADCKSDMSAARKLT